MRVSFMTNSNSRYPLGQVCRDISVDRKHKALMRRDKEITQEISAAATHTSFRLIGTILDLNAERKVLVQKAALLEDPLKRSREYLSRSKSETIIIE